MLVGIALLLGCVLLMTGGFEALEKLAIALIKYLIFPLATLLLVWGILRFGF